ncbi:MAG: hypothetical protein IKI19_00620 [Prevotella sp.]|nr:hypothetical protein [Prevotella sp.]
MRKTYLMILTAVLCLLAAGNVSAGERIPFDAEHFTFHTHDGWDVDAAETGTFEGNFLYEEANGCPIGDTGCNAWVDLGSYSKLYVKMEGCDADGVPNGSNPRIFINRTIDEGQFNADKSQSNCLVLPNGGWAAEYYTQEDDGTYVIDLKKIAREWGFVHFHSIKGSAWNTQAIVYSIEVEKAAAAQQVGWINQINNSDMEGEDASSFFSKTAQSAPYQSEITDGVGVNGSRGIVVEATAKAAEAWDNQFWFRFNEAAPEGTKYRVSFDYRADTEATVSTQAHNEPSQYNYWDMFGNLTFTTEWQTFTKEGTVTAQQARGDSGTNPVFQSVAFNLNELADANNYYFDNIKFEVYKYGTTAEFYMDIMKIDFGFDTNISELVAACGKPRLLFPKDMVSVTMDGEPQDIMTVEGFPDGRFYIFMEGTLEDDAEVEVSLKNPADAAYHLLYRSGPGGDITDFATPATFNDEIGLADDAYSYNYVKPVVIATDPEAGSFNLPNSLKQFKVTFDKNTDCAQLEAILTNGAQFSQKLSVTPADGFAEEVILNYEGEDLANGEYTLKLNHIFAEEPLTDDDYSTYETSFYIGKVEFDPDDVPTDVIPDYFATTNSGGIPEGYIVLFGEEERTSEGGGYSSGSRMFDFAEGGDFTKGLYFREGYVEYGSQPDHELALEAGKKYRMHFNTAMWKDNGTVCTFEILNEADEAVVSMTIENKPNVNGSYAAVNGSTFTEFDFVPEVDGKYRVKWTANGFVEVLLANVLMKYIPNQVGIEETQLLNTALENAKTVRDANNVDRYTGTAYDNLVSTILKYELEAPTYTAPSSFRKAAAALDAAAQAMKDHHSLCDKFDSVVRSAMETILANAENKFAKTDLYATLKAEAEQYATVDEELNITVTPEKDDIVMNRAITNMEALAKTCSLLFTEGPSDVSNTGVKVLVERLRLGAEALMSLGAAVDDELVVAAENALTDDDELVEKIKNSLKVKLYGQIKDGADLFPVLEDQYDDEGNQVTKSYDMTVFVKNPNIYKQTASTNYSEENVPGWIVPEGYNAPGLSVGWGSAQGSEQIAEDCMFQTWGPSYRIQQTIEDLPAGVYTLRGGFGERMDENAAPNALDDTYFFVQTSDLAAIDEFERADAGRIGQAFPHAAEGGLGSLAIKEVVITDGIVTLGVNACQDSHTFFNDVRVILTAAATGFDYAKAYEEVLAGIDETTANNVKTRAIAIYDLNGRRMMKAERGVNIVKSLMSDGTVRTQKVVIK